MKSLPMFTSLIVDLGDVLLTWSPDVMTSPVPWPMLKGMRTSGTWMGYERGRLSEYECYVRLAEFFIPEKDIASSYQQALGSLHVNGDLVALVPRVEGIGRYFAGLPFEWSIFDAVFPSGLIGERKPDRAIYDHLITAKGIDPPTVRRLHRHKAENVATARALGMRGVVFDCPPKAMAAPRGLFLGPLQRAAQFMGAHAGASESATEDGHSFVEYFAQLLILELTDDELLVSLPDQPSLWSFFCEPPLAGISNDLDTTSIAYTVLKHEPQPVTKVMDEMLRYTTDPGLFLTYFDHARRYADAFANVHILTLFFRNGRGGDFPEALHYILGALANRRYICGSRYYLSPDMYLYFMSRLLDSDAALRSRTMPVFTERVRERVGVPADPVDRAMRVIVCCKLGIDNEADLRELLAAQLPDGGWGVGWLYKFGKSGVKIGNRGVATAFAIRAVHMATQPTAGSSPL